MRLRRCLGEGCGDGCRGADGRVVRAVGLADGVLVVLVWPCDLLSLPLVAVIAHARSQAIGPDRG